MSKHNPKNHLIKEGIIILQSNHLGEVVEVHIDKNKKRFYGIKKDGSKVEDNSHCGNDKRQRVMLYKIKYFFTREPKDTWEVGYRIKGQRESLYQGGFQTAKEAWLYREELITTGIAER